MKNVKNGFYTRFCAIVLLTNSFYFVSYAQTFFRINWEKTLDINQCDKIYSVLKTNDGNYILAGESSSVSAPGQKLLLVKLNPNGEPIWIKTLGNTADCKFTSISKSGTDGFYILGTKKQGASNPLIWILKTDKDGIILWENTFGGGDNEFMTDVCETSETGLFLCGAKEIKGNKETDGWLVKLNKKGIIETQALFGPRYINDEFRSITSDKGGGYFLAGFTSEKLGAEKIPYFLHVDFRGNKIWEKSFPDFPRAIPSVVFFNPDGLLVCLMNIYSTSGEFLNITKMILNTTGGLINSYSIKQQLNISKNSFTCNEKDQYILLSEQNEDPSLNSEKYIIKLDQFLNPVWIKPMEMENVSLFTIYPIDYTNYISVGWTGQSTYISDIKVYSFRDYSDKLIESYVVQKLIANAQMNVNETLNDLKVRSGDMKFETLIDQYVSEAIRVLKLVPESTASNTIEKSELRTSNALSSTEKTGPNAEIAFNGKYYALLIAIEDYYDPMINDLDKPVKDAQKLFDVLINEYLFEKTNVTFLKNPNREQIISTLDRFEREMTKSDNLIIFYAGHGYWNETTQKGYWLPADASKQNTSNWIENSSVSDYIRSIPAKHTLLIADACFSGSIFKTRAAFGNQDLSATKQYELPSRKAMTSGTLTEVPDKSVFIDFLVKRLYENQETYLSSEQLFFSFKPAVINNTESIPQFGVVGNAGDEGGDFIFVKRKK
jgi:hypothetical protein